MKAGEQFHAEVQAALREVCGNEEILVDAIDVYLGANPFAPASVMICEIQAKPFAVATRKIVEVLEARFPEMTGVDPGRELPPSEVAARLVARLSAVLLNCEIGVEMRSGTIAGPGGAARCWLEFLPFTPAGPALKAALVAVAEASSPGPEPTRHAERHISTLREISAHSRPSAPSSMVLSAARKRDLPFLSVGRSKSIWQVGWGSRSESFQNAASNGDGFVGFSIARNKLVAKHLFRELGLPTPRWNGIPPEGDIAKSLERVGWPCVVKPVDGSCGEGITTGIRDMGSLAKAVDFARRHTSTKLLVEAHESGHDHRLMVIDGRFFAGVRREAPSIVGDGRSNVRQLLNALNAARRGPPEKVGYLIPVAIDAALQARLAELHLTMDSILAESERLILRSTANRATGGICIDVTDQVHPQVRRWAEHLAIAVGLRAAGIDYITPDIGGSPEEVGGGFTEINATPCLMVLAAAGLDRIRIGSAVLADRPGRIPVTLVLVGEESREQVYQSVRAKAADESGHAVASLDWAELDGSVWRTDGMSAFDIVVAALRQKAANRLTFVWTPEEMYRLGLPVDRLETTMIIGRQPEKAWLSLLHDISSEVLVAEEVPEALEALAPAS